MKRLIPLLALLAVASCSPRESSADGEVAQQADDELERAIAADPLLRDAVKSIDAGHPWKATGAHAPKLGEKKVLINGCIACPPSLSAAKYCVASAGLFTVSAS